MEHNQTAADGTVYDNGYGICMIPVFSITDSSNTYGISWGGTNDDSNILPYMSSNLHSYLVSTATPALQTVLGDHLVLRNVLLSNVCTSYIASSYVWTTAYCTAMSMKQLVGFIWTSSVYNTGEANYKLPLFNYIPHQTSDYSTRGIYGRNNKKNKIIAIKNGLFDGSDGLVGFDSGNTNVGVSSLNYVRPMIYIR